MSDYVGESAMVGQANSLTDTRAFKGGVQDAERKQREVERVQNRLDDVYPDLVSILDRLDAVAHRMLGPVPEKQPSGNETRDGSESEVGNLNNKISEIVERISQIKSVTGRLESL